MQMPMRRTIGILLVCLVTSPRAIAETPEQNITRSTSVAPENAETPTDRSLCAPTQERWTAHGSARVAQRSASFKPVTEACDGISDPCCGPMRVSGISQFGKASWYDLVGGQTASGEMLDTVTATAAHRSLPLDTYAKVTNLRNHRSVIVKINDRGPYIHGRIIDLSPRSADALAMKGAGVVAVVVEPLVY